MTLEILINVKKRVHICFLFNTFLNSKKGSINIAVLFLKLLCFTHLC